MRLSAHLNLIFGENQLGDGIETVAAADFDGIEVYGFERDNEVIREKCQKHDLEWTYLSGERPDCTDPANHETALDSIEKSVQIAHGIDCSIVNVKSGQIQRTLDVEPQRQSVIEILRAAAPIAEEYDVTLVLEPLNAAVDHPNHFTTTIEEGVEIVSAVDSPHVKLLFDFYHEQISTGDLIRSFQKYVEFVGHIHIADNPGRHEPGTGEINYRNILRTIQESSYDGYVGCEFIPKQEPLAALRGVRDLI